MEGEADLGINSRHGGVLCDSRDDPSMTPPRGQVRPRPPPRDGACRLWVRPVRQEHDFPVSVSPSGGGPVLFEFPFRETYHPFRPTDTRKKLPRVLPSISESHGPLPDAFAPKIRYSLARAYATGGFTPTHLPF